jgi:hypothetical protein
MSAKQEYMRLTDEFRESFNWKAPGLSRQGFCQWARQERVPFLRLSERDWAPLKEGMAIAREKLAAFSEYISDVLNLGRYPLSKIAVACPPEPQPQAGMAARVPNAYRVGWAGLYGYLARNFTIPEEAYCQNESDVAAAARMVAQAVCREETKAGETAIARGEGAIGSAWDGYSSWLLSLCRANEKTVLFTLGDEQAGTRPRIGVSVVVPLKREFYESFRRGEALDSDIGPEHLAAASEYLLVDAIAENHDLSDVRRAKARRSMSQAGTVLFQLASLCPPLERFNVNPRIISFAGTRENEERLRAYSFVEIGTQTRLTGRTILELAPPSAAALRSRYPLALAQYIAMKAALLLYQASIAAQQRLDEK